MKRILLLTFLLVFAISSNAQFFENFDDASVTAPTGNTWVLPSGTWRMLNNGVGTQHFTMSPEGSSVFPANTMPHAAFISRENIGSGNTSIDYLVTPLKPVYGANSDFRFNTRSTISGTQFTTFELRAAPASADPTNMASFTTLLATWTEDGLSIPFNVYETKLVSLGQLDPAASYYFAFVRKLTQPDGNIAGDRWLIDDVAILPYCSPPVMGTFSYNALGTSLQLSWDANVTSQWEVHILEENQFFDPQAGTPVMVSSPHVQLFETTQPIAADLQPQTTYKIYVRSICEQSGSEWIGPITCSTSPLSPECGGGYVDSGGIAGNYPPNANEILTICPDAPADQVTVTFTQFNTETQFDGLYVFDGSSTSAPQISSNNGPGNVPGGLSGAYWGNTIPGPFTSSSPDGCLTFWFRSDSANNLAGWLADISCAPPQECMKPYEVTIAPGDEWLEIDWSEAAFATQWEVLVLPCGSPAPNANAPGGILTSEHPFTVNDLIPETCYTVYVRAVCSDTSNSLWSNPVDMITDGGDQVVLQVFLDTNGNGVKDTSESFFGLGEFTIEENGSQTTQNVYSFNGITKIVEPDPSSSFDLSFSVYPEFVSYYSVNPASYANVTTPDGSGTQTFNFPVTVEQAYTDIRVTITPYGQPRPAIPYANIVTVKNLGVAAASGTLTYTKDPEVAITGYPDSTTPTATGFTYDFTDLQPGQHTNLYVTLLPLSTPDVNAGDILTNSASVPVAPSESNAINNSFSSSQTVVNSYDPNDITEAHGPQIDIDEFSTADYLYYTIRFQNTGTADAIDIRIENTLDTQLDPQSVRMVAASHDYVMARINNQLTWHFDNIHLPYQEQSEELSQGWLLYEVKVNPGFEIGDVIPAVAEIYFDTNPAVVTETFHTTFVDALATPEFSGHEVLLYPNPAQDSFTVRSIENGRLLSKVNIQDVLGKTILSKEVTPSAEISIAVDGLSKGMYLVELITSDNLRTVKKLILK